MMQATLLRSTALAFAVSLALAGCGSSHKGAAPSAPSGNSSGNNASSLSVLAHDCRPFPPRNF
ncbi:hypothetical protein JKG47_21710 [Acidithiobacillus sp. MC6.1]|nr:hypothetical protein [Acidithiobacillus sp. MC6.1]